MKKIILMSLVALFATTAIAQDNEQNSAEFPRHYIEFGVGDPFMNQIYLDTWSSSSYNYYSWFGPNIYSNYWCVLPNFHINYRYSVLKWLQVGGEIYYGGYYSQACDIITDEYLGMNNQTQISLVASVRFQYLNRPRIGIYSGVALGAQCIYTDEYEINDPQVYFLPAFQFTAIGLRAGNRIYGTIELGWGNKGFANVGIGARF